MTTLQDSLFEAVFLQTMTRQSKGKAFLMEHIFAY